jgi:hypothetical protein
LGDLAGVTEIETLDLGAGSRRGSFSKPKNESGARGSESKDRRDPINTSAIGIPRPNTGPSYDGANFKRPQTSEVPNITGMISGAYSIGGGAGGGILVQDRNFDNIRKSNNPYSEAASSYKDDDDALSHYMGQSEYGGMSNLGGIGGGGGLGGPSSLIPTIDTGKSRRMAGGGRPSVTGKSINNDDAGPPTLSKNPSNKNYGLFLQEDASSNNRGAGSKPGTGGGLFGAERSNSPNRDPTGLDFGFGRPPTGITQANNRHSSAHANNTNNNILFNDAGSSIGNKNRDHSIGDINSQGGGIKSLFKDDPLLKPLAGAGVIRPGAGDATPKSNLGSNLGGPAGLGGFTLG